LSLLAGLDRLSAGELTVAGHEPESLQRSRSDRLSAQRRRHDLSGLQPAAHLDRAGKRLPAGDSWPAVAYQTVRSRARELLDWLGLGDRLSHQPRQLSGGEMQRTAIARALINDPAIVLADEPTGNLDSSNARKVMALLADLNRQFNRTVVVATHSDLADSYATMTLRLQDGRVAA
jgi:putative ABC transport system ATP-binding protein